MTDFQDAEFMDFDDHPQEVVHQIFKGYSHQGMGAVAASLASKELQRIHPDAEVSVFEMDTTSVRGTALFAVEILHGVQ
jgi:hypothetical protein